MSTLEAIALYITALVTLCIIARRQCTSVSVMTPVGLVLAVLAIGDIALSSAHGFRISIGLAVALACVVVSAASDLATGLIFDTVTAVGACGIVLCAVIEQTMSIAALGACVCFVPLLALYAITRGRGIGLGDVKLGGIIGAGIGGVEALDAVGAAFIAGAIYCAPLLLARRLVRNDRVPFAPFMALGTIALVAARGVQSHG
jgi:prepilin signal peptidase PulO-like enzyme (type II secretory pathway)